MTTSDILVRFIGSLLLMVGLVMAWAEIFSAEEMFGRIPFITSAILYAIIAAIGLTIILMKK
jgi:hypothetical protein